MNILDKIVEEKLLFVEASKRRVPLERLEAMVDSSRKKNSLRESISNSSNGIIAEFKRKSPSKGFIKEQARVEDIIPLYEKNNVAGISVLTDTPFFGGSTDDLIQARRLTQTPILRKDFMIDPYQIVEAAAYGADAVLLIAACLEKRQAGEMASLAHQLGLDVLLEVHSQKEIEYYDENVDIIGVNNRNLKTFVTDIAQSIELAQYLPSSAVKISESGITTADQMQQLRRAGFSGFLIGENFMKQLDPESALSLLV